MYEGKDVKWIFDRTAEAAEFLEWRYRVNSGWDRRDSWTTILISEFTTWTQQCCQGVVLESQADERKKNQQHMVARQCLPLIINSIITK